MDTLTVAPPHAADTQTLVRAQLVSLPTRSQVAGVAGGLGVVVRVNRSTVSVRRLYDDRVLLVPPAELRDEEVRCGLAAGHTAAMHGWPEATDATSMPRRQLVVVACGATKRAAPSPARDLYTGPLFRSSWEAAERVGVPALILSARHGLVDPDTILAPYDATLDDVGAVTASHVAAGAAQRDLADVDVAVFGGRRYVDLVRAVWPDAHAPLEQCGGIGAMRGRLARIASWEDATAAVPA